MSKYTGSVDQVAVLFRHRAIKARQSATEASTQKDARFLEGQGYAFDEAAKVLEELEVAVVPDLIWEPMATKR